MPRIQPKGGVNLRYPAYEMPRNQWLLMQNMDMTHAEIFEQIKGSIKYHGTSLGTNPVTAIMPYYDNTLGKAEILVAIDDSIYKKNEGSNEFVSLKAGLTPNKIRFSEDVGNNKYIVHSTDGIFQYDGASIDKVNGSPNLTDMIFAKEINRAFGISADIPNGIFFTDDVSTMGGLPLLWNALNADSLPPTRGDVIEKLGFLNGRLVAFMTNSTWINYVNGSPANWRWEKSPTVVGWIAPKTIKQVGQEYWGLGHSTETGIGLYAFNGQTARLLSYDVEPYMKRINENRVQDACAEIVDNIYKLSFALDSSLTNNCTFHVDTINVNGETDMPNFYGPHTYGFEASAVLNTRKFRGQHLFTTTHGGGSWVFQVGNYFTQHASGPADDGDLVPCVLLTPIYTKETIGGAEYDERWIKRYRDFHVNHDPLGAWDATVDILKDSENETYRTFQDYLDGENIPIDGLDLGFSEFNKYQYSSDQLIIDVRTNAFQVKLSNLNVRTKTGFSSLLYEASAVRQHKGITKVKVA